ncbi:hypothetical protein [Desulfuromonas thiophila]|jgi:hypothetical protein|uniref:Uncharacterized protein n=1 Tax=Desulfuromonas thiophila TaxID=57664 RepID=A0A1G7C4J3_9BACT|nr:hypothetical protein [Desulfuromonas thiophila]MCK9172261.1 hypothetical protein [Desulfuromonas thiophila]MDD3802299.1 hypothetical protein [Desulfuromonas thiophila]MDY0398549.1 hypothetical protein [Desulfuromonas thiophila]SDE34282.1 hypothetical protein SAMN05661003_10871 [Desulfuromonas thiophila]
MRVRINPSDLQYRYPRKKQTRDLPKFSGLPDPAPFDRFDLYEVIPLFEQVMSQLGSRDGRVLQHLEELVNSLPTFIHSREEVFCFLVESVAPLLASAGTGKAAALGYCQTQRRQVWSSD